MPRGKKGTPDGKAAAANDGAGQQDIPGTEGRGTIAPTLAQDTPQGMEQRGQPVDAETIARAFQRPRDVTLAVTAMESWAADTEKQAKKDTDAGYTRHAREKLADVGAIRERIIRGLKEQGELPLATQTEARSGLANWLVQDMLRMVAGKRTPEDMATEIAGKVENFAEALATRAFEAGYAARENEPAALVLFTLDALQRQGES